ncbi:hypothetical protein ACGF0D_35285 [Kitasatospora sp. NPDC048298]
MSSSTTWSYGSARPQWQLSSTAHRYSVPSAVRQAVQHRRTV